MTRPAILAAILLSLGLPARADDARQAFLSHQPGQPLLDAARYPLARQVEEGCLPPCVSPAEVAAYLKDVDSASAAFGLKAEDAARAREHYAPQGVPRKKASARQGAPSLEGGRSPLPKGTGARLEARMQGIASTLGLSRFLAADDAPVQAARLPGGAVQTAPAPKAQPLPVPVLAAAPLQPSQVDGRMRDILNTGIAKYPTGRALISSMKTPPPVVLEKLDSYDTVAQHSGKGRKEKISLNTLVLADPIKSIDPSAAKAGDLTDPAVMRRYLAAHPDVMPRLAGAFDAWYVHELTHAAQYRRSGPGAFNDWKNGWVDILNGMKYPIEMEWEAFGTQDRYFHEKARADPSVLRMNGPFPATVIEYTDYIDNIDKYRRDKAALYQGDVAPIDKLRLHSQKEKDYYAAALAQERREWPRRSAEGHILVARNWNSQNVPTMGLPDLKAAYDRAVEGKFLDELRPQLVSAFQETLAGVEARLAKAEAEGKTWSIGEPASGIIKSLSAALKAPLPARTAKALGKR